MLTVADRHVIALDANDNQLGYLVTAYPGRVVQSAQLMSDHQTIWYVTSPDDYETATYKCSDVVRLDLVTNTRTVIAHADWFSASDDGSRVVLLNEVGEAACRNDDNASGRNVVRDVASGAESPIVAENSGPAPQLSPDASTLVATNCTSDAAGCHYGLISAAVPAKLGPAITLKPVNDPMLSFLSLMPRPDGLYALVDKHAQNCGCGGREERYDRDLSVRRMSWTDLGGSGTTLYTVQGPRYFEQIVPTDAGVVAFGAESVKSKYAIYHVADGNAWQVTQSGVAPNYWQVFPMP
jgi:hypothetical protein